MWKSFGTVESLDPDHLASCRLKIWNDWDNKQSDAIQRASEHLPTGSHLQRRQWVALNRARAGILHRWKHVPNSECPCGNPKQTMDHILSECIQGPHCTEQDLRDCSGTAPAWINHWCDKIMMMMNCQEKLNLLSLH